MKILYEITYATRGQSGIPRDTKALAKIMVETEKIQTDFLLNPRSYSRRRKQTSNNSQWISNELGAALRREPGRSAIPSIFISALTLLQSLSLRRAVATLKVDASTSVNVFKFLQLDNSAKKSTKSSFFLLSISYLARFARPRFLKPFRIRTNSYQVFIQQQADPIQVDKKTTHIVRLHDLLPISHPQYFDQIGVAVFAKSLRIMLSGNKKIWVMDSESTAQDFKRYFGKHLDVRVIPCVVETKRIGNTHAQRKNQVCMVNSVEPRKRISLAISGFRQAKESEIISQDWNLVIVGNKGWGQLKKSIDIILNQANYPKNRLHFTGYIELIDLIEIYKQASLFISTSLNEGLGLPQLEAMALGVPVISPDNSAMKEVVTGAGITVKTWNMLDWQTGIDEIATNRDFYIKKGYERVLMYNWDKVVIDLNEKILINLKQNFE
jgi:glycosyltransferase involved in cell wall biosynthesis